MEQETMQVHISMLNEDVKDIRYHVDIINCELGQVRDRLAGIEAKFVALQNYLFAGIFLVLSVQVVFKLIR